MAQSTRSRGPEGSRVTYIHGTDAGEQERLRLLNRLTNVLFIEFLAPRSTDSVIEVGSGLGLLAADIAEKVPQGSVVGVEFSAEQLAHPPGRPNLRFIMGDAHRIPCLDGVFDLAYCRYILEHVGDPAHVLTEIHRVLRPGGRVCIQENNILINDFDPDCPAFDYVWRQFALLQQRLGGDATVGKKLFRLLGNAGFKEIRLSIAPEIHHAGQETFGPWVMNLLGNIRSAERALIEGGYVTEGEYRSACRELEGLMERKDASAYFYWNRAAATKPAQA